MAEQPGEKRKLVNDQNASGEGIEGTPVQRMAGTSPQARPGVKPAAGMQAHWRTTRRILKKALVHVGYHSRPTFLIIGTIKGGTTSLFHYLRQHPSILPSSRKSIYFFTPEVLPLLHEPAPPTLSCENGIGFLEPEIYRGAAAWYHCHFPLPYELGPHGITFEATADYLYHSQAAERIHLYHPGMKLIALLRDPVERAFSHWNMFRSFGRDRRHSYYHLAENRPFEEVILEQIDTIDSTPEFATDYVRYVRFGRYCEQLLRYFQYFGREQILVLDSSTFRNNSAEALNRVTEFLELPRWHWDDVDLTPHLVGRYESLMSERARAMLREFYRPYNEALYNLLERDFRWQ